MTRPFLGILMLDTHFPRIKGDIGNPASFDFPVRYKIVKGASAEKIVLKADPEFIRPMIAAGQELIREGASMITTSCGFLAIFQEALSKALTVPVLASSLLHIPGVYAALPPGRTVGILTARAASLTPRHLEGAGVGDIPLRIGGMDHAPEFSRVFIGDAPTLTPELCRAEMAEAARTLVRTHPDIGSIVLECTNMPPYTDAVREATGLPVHDILTLLNTAWRRRKQGPGRPGNRVIPRPGRHEPAGSRQVMNCCRGFCQNR